MFWVWNPKAQKLAWKCGAGPWKLAWKFGVGRKLGGVNIFTAHVWVRRERCEFWETWRCRMQPANWAHIVVEHLKVSQNYTKRKLFFTFWSTQDVCELCPGCPHENSVLVCHKWWKWWSTWNLCSYCGHLKTENAKDFGLNGVIVASVRSVLRRTTWCRKPFHRLTPTHFTVPCQTRWRTSWSADPTVQRIAAKVVPVICPALHRRRLVDFLLVPEGFESKSSSCGGVLLGHGAKLLSGGARDCYPRH